MAQQGRDFVLVRAEAWAALSMWYDFRGVFPRTAGTHDDGTVHVDPWPRVYTLYAAGEDGRPAAQQTWALVLDARRSVGDVILEVRGAPMPWASRL